MGAMEETLAKVELALVTVFYSPAAP